MILSFSFLLSLKLIDTRERVKGKVKAKSQRYAIFLKK